MSRKMPQNGFSCISYALCLHCLNMPSSGKKWYLPYLRKQMPHDKVTFGN